MKKVLILGATGMLGHRLYLTLREDFEVWGSARVSPGTLERYGIYDLDTVVGDVDAADIATVRSAIERACPEVVVNAIGIVKQALAGKDMGRLFEVNAIFPHRLAELADEYKFRTITVSTDCVFKGDRGDYTERDSPDALDPYGISKRFGELKRPHTLTLRTSIIGRELNAAQGLLEWFLANAGSNVAGYGRALFSGLTTTELSAVIGKVIEEHPGLDGIYHVSGPPISKHDLLLLCNDLFATRTSISRSDDLVIDRTLNSARFRAATGWRPPSWPEMLSQIAADPTPYERFHASE